MIMCNFRAELHEKAPKRLKKLEWLSILIDSAASPASAASATRLHLLTWLWVKPALPA